MIKIAVTGAAGRMGRTLIQAIQETPGLVLAAAVEQPGFSGLGADAGELAGVGRLEVPVVADLAAVAASFDVLIDFTVAAATVPNLEVCARYGKAMIIGTTGHD